MHPDTELAQFRARWQQEVAQRRAEALRGTPAAQPADAPRHAPPADAPSADAPDDVPDAPADGAAPDRLARILDTLVPAHEAAAADAALDIRMRALDVGDGADGRADDSRADDSRADGSRTDGSRADDGARAAARAATPEIPTPDAEAPPDGGPPAPRPIRTVHELHAADEERPIPAARLPDEVWLCVFLHAVAPVPAPPPSPRMGEHTVYRPPAQPWRVWTGPDYVTLEACARACWKFRLLTAHARLWRAVAHATYVWPQVPPAVRVAALRAERAASWRDLFVYQPRVRQHGTYIASCQYTQQGLSEENVWVRVLHVVEFYRYLRFFPNGQCLSMLTTDTPADVVHQLVPGLRAKGLAAGRWRLLPGAADATVVVEDLHDATLPGYRFQMTLHLHASPGRWHKLDLIEHASLNLHTGEVLPFPRQKHLRPFYFSRVRGYGV